MPVPSSKVMEETILLVIWTTRIKFALAMTSTYWYRRAPQPGVKANEWLDVASSDCRRCCRTLQWTPALAACCSRLSCRPHASGPTWSRSTK